MICVNNGPMRLNGRWLNYTPPPPIYYVYTSGDHGVVVAIPSSGISGTEVTLSNTPDTGYALNSYSVTGATLKNDNQFDIANSDVYVHGNFIDPYDPSTIPPNTIRVRTNGGRPITHYGHATYERATLLPGTLDIYDVYKSGTSFFQILYDSYNVTEIIGANTTGITNMNSMLADLPLITSVPLFDTSSVTGMRGMFARCTSLTTVPSFNTSNVTTMESMFEGCTALTEVPLFNTSNVTNMSIMFRGCTSLITVPLFNTSNVTTMNSMFSVCGSLTSVPLFNTSNVTNMGSMFESCTSLTTVPLFNTRKVTLVPYMLRNCTNVESGALALYNQMSTQSTPPSNHNNTFEKCGRDTVTGAAELAQIPTSWGGTLST